MTNILAAASYHWTTPLEIWLPIVTMAFFVSVFNVIDAYKDAKYLEKAHLNGFRKIIARESLLTEISRTIVQILFIIIGIASLFAPYLLSLAMGIKIFQWLFAGCFIFAAVLLAGNTILSRFTRRLVYGYKVKEDHSLDR